MMTRNSLYKLVVKITLFIGSLLIFPQLAFAQVSPDAYMFKAMPGNSGEVNLMWMKQANTDNYDLVFGEAGQPLTFGAQDIGNVDSYVVRFLQPGKDYDFVLRPKMSGQTLTMTDRVKAMAGTKGAVKPVAKVAVAAPAPVPAVSSGPVGKYSLSAKQGDNRGEVKLSWSRDTSVDTFDVVYGTSPDKFTFGAQDISDMSGFTVKALTPGVTYYFMLLPQKSGAPLDWTDQVKAASR